MSSPWVPVFWASFLLVLYTFFGYPLLVVLIAALSRPRPRLDPGSWKVALVVAAYNEEEIIEKKIENCLALDYPAELLQIVLVTDGSDDATPAIVERYRDRGVTLLHESERRGKAAAIDRAMPLIDCDIVVFSDANTFHDPSMLRSLLWHFSDPGVGGVAGEKRVAGGGEGIYWRYESLIKKSESSFSSVMGAAGELFAIRKDLYRPVGSDVILDDFIISMRLVEMGHRLVYEPSAFALEQPTSSPRSDWKRRVRIAAGGVQSTFALLPLLDPRRGTICWQFLSHRVIRWMVTPFAVFALFLSNIFLPPRPFYLLVLLGQVLAALLALYGYMLARRGRKNRIATTFFYFYLTNLAAVFGFFRFLSRRQSGAWERAR